ncbi:hypothetical protein [Streptomyces albidocamelliae]|uniref:Secreted protein n=1 Tax=Streptomyces albidocamelliae TaxID=2981135 RepID=A0ABY6ET44_9ACTN|nr:hypothetical protein [Streptomyces sp. HUAS 14-6]UXY37569.1 hypothetical protein N8I86_24280 [Streptomyces sp. HUAS 14-6]
MSIRFTAKAHKGVVALTLAVGLAVSVAGCGGGGNDDKKPQASASASKGRGSGPSTQEGQSETPLAELKGTEGLLLQVTSAQRDAGGFVTVSGNLKNDGGKSVVVPPQMSGDETEIVKHGLSLGGATLVDPKGKKRYYVLRDTEGRPLTTTGLGTLQGGQSLPVFMQFPAPPTNTTEVTLQLPTFSSAGIQISG